MAQVPPHYPNGCTDDELTIIVRDLGSELLKHGAGINDVMRIQPLIAIGQAELQSRLIKSTSDQLVLLQEVIKEFQQASESASHRLAVLTGVLITLTSTLVGLTIALLVR